MFFALSGFLLALILFVLALILFAVVFGSTLVGLSVRGSQRHRSEHLREPFAALQAALLRIVGPAAGVRPRDWRGRHHVIRIGSSPADAAQKTVAQSFITLMTVQPSVAARSSACSAPVV